MCCRNINPSISLLCGKKHLQHSSHQWWGNFCTFDFLHDLYRTDSFSCKTGHFLNSIWAAWFENLKHYMGYLHLFKTVSQSSCACSCMCTTLFKEKILEILSTNNRNFRGRAMGLQSHCWLEVRNLGMA